MLEDEVIVVWLAVSLRLYIGTGGDYFLTVLHFCCHFHGASLIWGLKHMQYML